MKSFPVTIDEVLNKVALLVSAWIEISVAVQVDGVGEVALLVSAWIEMLPRFVITKRTSRRTPRECVD